MANLYSVHMDAHIFPSPETFDPARFLDKAGELINTEYCIPFCTGTVFLLLGGGGLHIRNHPSACVDLSCLHQEIFTFGALEARVRRTSSFLAPAGKCFSCRVCVKKGG